MTPKDVEFYYQKENKELLEKKRKMQKLKRLTRRAKIYANAN
jgi:hypothetical protein